MFTHKELNDFYDSLPESGKDCTKAEFMAEVKKILDPKRNAQMLNQMTQLRHQEAIARHNARVIEKAQERSRLGLR